MHSALTHWYRSIQSGRVTEDPFRYSYQFIYLAHFKPRVHRRWLNIHLKLIWIIKCPKVWNYLLIFIIKINLLHSFCTHAGFSDWCLLCLHLVTLWETGLLLLCNWACERHENHLSLKLNFIKLKLVLIISVSLTPERRVKLIFEFVYRWHRWIHVVIVGVGAPVAMVLVIVAVALCYRQRNRNSGSMWM